MSTELLKQNLKLRNEVKSLQKENAIQKKVIVDYRNKLSFSENKIKQLEQKMERYENEESKRIEEIVNKAVKKAVDEVNKIHQEEVGRLNAKIKKLETKLNIDSTNSNTPSSKNKIGKSIPQNNREATDKSKGAQPGHKQYKLNNFTEDEITDRIEHTLDSCPKCDSELKEKNTVISDIIDITITVTKTRNYIKNYYCSACKKIISANSDLPRGVSYGNNINAIGLSMMNESNTALNKITSFIKGITNGEVNMSEGYLVKLQKKSAKNLNDYIINLQNHIKNQEYLFWDDTVIKFGIEKPEEDYDDKDKTYMQKYYEENKTSKYRNGIIRFYGNDLWAYLVGHRNKDKDGVNDDDILCNLPNTCTVMHDHVLLNYNEEYKYKNAECNEHSCRYLKKYNYIFPDHTWSINLRNFLYKINKEKQELMKNNVFEFSNEKIIEIENEYMKYINIGYSENKKVELQFIQDKIDEFNLITRLEKFKDNHLLFIKDFNVEFTNNTAERGLRQSKRKLAVSFMFKNANRMKDYAVILSYLETCYRHGLTRYEAAKRLVQNKPLTVNELVLLETE